MGMFLNYHNIADNYRPNNLINAFPTRVNTNGKLDPVTASKPYEEYDAKGDLEGYFWRYGDTLNLEFNLDGEITIESDALVSATSGVEPTEDTVGYIGQRAYNVTDMQSWTCVSIIDGAYGWKQDEEFTYPINSDRSVYIPAEDYLSSKQIDVTLYNFRLEPICSKVYNGVTRIVFPIDKELSSLLVKGIYYCSVRVFDELSSLVVFEPTDCKLLVK